MEDDYTILAMDPILKQITYINNSNFQNVLTSHLQLRNHT